VRSEVIARNYADTLLALAQRNGGIATAHEFQVAADDLAQLLRTEPRVRAFLSTPAISIEAKKAALRGALRAASPSSSCASCWWWWRSAATPCCVRSRWRTASGWTS
jgi:F0F1-type ATP synthase delta subunit